MTGDVLDALCDASFTALDLAAAGPQLQVAAVQRAAERLPQLQALDVSGLPQVTAGALAAVGRCCPQLAVLRLGGGRECSAAAEAALPSILPEPQSSATADDWEAAGGGKGSMLPYDPAPVLRLRVSWCFSNLFAHFNSITNAKA